MVTSDPEFELIPIEKLMNIKDLHLKTIYNVEQQLTYPLLVQNEPLITRTETKVETAKTSNQKYNKLLPLIHRFQSRATNIGTDQFNKVFTVFQHLTETIENNNIEILMKKLGLDEKEEEESDPELVSLDIGLPMVCYI